MSDSRTELNYSPLSLRTILLDVFVIACTLFPRNMKCQIILLKVHNQVLCQCIHIM